MYRTTIMLPNELKNRAANYAQKLGLSLGELIREALELRLSANSKIGEDPLFTDSNYYQGKADKNIAAEHDKLLYGEME